MLNEALNQAWAAEPRRGKLTREERARLLGLSVVTARRVLEGQPVDRPTLTVAFKSLGLTWDDSFCEFVVSTEPEEAVEPVPIELPKPRKRRWLIPALAGVAAMLLIGFLLSARTADPNAWRYGFNRKMEAAEAAYRGAKYSVARERTLEAIELARRHENATCLAGALRMDGDLAMAAGRFQQARDRFDEALKIRRHLRQTDLLPAVLEALGTAELRLGHFDEARMHFEECLLGYRKTHDRPGMAMALRGLGAVRFDQGRWAEATKYFEEALAVLDGTPQVDLMTDLKSRIALVWREEGEFAAAQDALEKSLAHWTQKGHARWIATARMQLATVLIRSGKDGRSLLTESRKEFRELGDTAGVAECDRWLSVARLP